MYISQTYFATNQGSRSIIEVLLGCLLGISPHLARDNPIPRRLQDLVTIKWLNINTSNVYCFVFAYLSLVVAISYLASRVMA